MAPFWTIHDDDLKQGLVRAVCDRFQVNGGPDPTAWPIRRWRMETAHDQRDTEKAYGDQTSFVPFSISNDAGWLVIRQLFPTLFPGTHGRPGPPLPEVPCP